MKQTCNPVQSLSRATLLGLLPKNPDFTRAIVVQTGEVIDISQMSQTVILEHINNGQWVYFETLHPRQMFLTNPNWSILSFDPATSQVCVEISTRTGLRYFSVLLRPYITKF